MAWNQRHHDCTNEYPVYIRVYDVQWQIILCRVIKIYTMIYFYALCCPCFKRRCCCTSRILVKATSPVSRLVDCVMENCCLEMELVEFCSLRLHWNSRVFPKKCEPVVIMRSFLWNLLILMNVVFQLVRIFNFCAQDYKLPSRENGL